jgi:L(+)-tartrate dehydratase beta subunit
MFDRGRTTRFDLAGHAVIHTAPNVRKVAPSPLHPAGYAPVCVGTTTSMRMERFTEPLLRQYGVRLVIGKGGLGPASAAAFRTYGGAYLAIVGGTAALETTWIEAITDVDLDDLNPESLWKFRVRGFGPLLVAMDSHGGSRYADVDAQARTRRAAALAALRVKPAP